MEKKTPEQVAKEKMDEINKSKEAKAAKEKEEVEARDAAARTSRETQKTKEELEAEKAKDLREKAEAQAKKDEAILAKKEEDLTEEEKPRKTELLKIKAKVDAEAKEKAKQEKIDKRIGELTGRIKDLERAKDVDHAEIEKIKAEKAELEKRLAPPKDEKEAEKKAETERITKYLGEDKSKPREERREMANEELEVWLLEDPVSANTWIAERTLRRTGERYQFRQFKQREEFIKDLTAKQSESAKRAAEKHPELDVDKRTAELKAEGKSNEEILKILCEENPKYKLVVQILSEEPDYLGKANAPELVAAEMEKRLKDQPSKEEKEKQEAAAQKKKEEEEANIRKDAAEEERQRLAAIDEGLGPAGEGKPGEGEELSEFDQAQQGLAAKVGISKERLAKAKKRREKIPGATIGKG